MNTPFNNVRAGTHGTFDPTVPDGDAHPGASASSSKRKRLDSPFEPKSSGLASPPPAADRWVNLSVGGMPLLTKESTLRLQPSRLQDLIGPTSAWASSGGRNVLAIDEDGPSVRLLLDYLRTGKFLKALPAAEQSGAEKTAKRLGMDLAYREMKHFYGYREDRRRARNTERFNLANLALGDILYLHGLRDEAVAKWDKSIKLYTWHDVRELHGLLRSNDASMVRRQGLVHLHIAAALHQLLEDGLDDDAAFQRRSERIFPHVCQAIEREPQSLEARLAVQLVDVRPPHMTQQAFDLWKLEQYREAMRIDPDCSDAWLEMGTIYHDQSDDEKAILCWDSAINLDPQNISAHFYRAESLARLKKPFEARLELAAVRTLDSENVYDLDVQRVELMLQEHNELLA